MGAVTPSRSTMAQAPMLKAWAVLAVPAVLWGCFYLPYLINVPRSDDFPSLLTFASNWADADGWGSRWELLFAQYFSHRIVLTRLAALGSIGIFGHLNLVPLQALGIVLWLGLAAWFTCQAIKRQHSSLAGLPVALLLLQPLGHTNITTAMQGVQNHGILVLALAACVMASRCTTAAGTAVNFLAAVAAMLTSANGILVPPLLAFAMIVRRQWGPGVIVAAGAVGALWVWFQGYAFGEHRFAPGEAMANVLVMIGAPYNFGRFPPVTTLVVGAVLITAVLLALSRPRTWTDSTATGLFALFLLGSAALAAIGRIGWGADYMQQDRYSAYGLLLAASLWLLAPPLSPARRRPILLTATAVATLFSAAAYARIYPQMVEEKRWAHAVAANQRYGEPMSMYREGRATDTQSGAIRAELLRLPPITFAESVFADLGRHAAPRPATPAAFGFKAQFDAGRGVYVLRPTAGNHPAPAAYALVSGEQARLLPGFAVRETYLRMLRHGRIVNPQQIGFIWPYPEPPSTPLRIQGLAIDPDGRHVVLWEGQVDPS